MSGGGFAERSYTEAMSDGGRAERIDTYSKSGNGHAERVDREYILLLPTYKQEQRQCKNFPEDDLSRELLIFQQIIYNCILYIK
jgi:hypothetical protein